MTRANRRAAGRWPCLVVFAALAFTLTQAPPLTAQCDDCVFPGDTWEALRGPQLAEHGWDADALQQAAAFLRDSANSTGVVVAHRGRVVFSFGDVEELSYLASVRKSILAMLYGHWVGNGAIDLDATLEDLGVNDIGGLLPIERQATVDHLEFVAAARRIAIRGARRRDAGAVSVGGGGWTVARCPGRGLGM